MKKTILAAAAILAAGLSAAAQDFTDALRYSENEYEGTARTMAMGNAFTALGGDMGSLGINPAGSAVARHSQFTVSLGPNITIGTAQGTKLPDGETAFGRGLRKTGAKFSLPNLGGMVNFSTGRSRGLKNWSMGFVVNNTRSYDEDFTARGTNYRTSAFAALASRADALGYTSDELGADGIYDKIYVSDWDVATAYQSGAIWPIGERNFAGITEWEDGENLSLGASGLDQRYGRTRTGTKSDFIYNLGFNFSDIFYLGANVGITSAGYTNSEFMREDAISPDDFDVIFPGENGGASITTNFTSAKSTYVYDADVTGVYGKFGFILTPWRGLRFGAAIQTPTAITVKEKITYGAEGNYENSKYSANAKCSGEFKYNLKAPLRANFGTAYTFGKYGLFSIDYELTNYRKMRFSDPDSSDDSGFDGNNQIYDLCGVQHYLRLGAEVKPADFFSVRLGYTLKTNGQTYEYEDDGKTLVQAPQANVHTASFGLGFSSGAFFADFAAVGYFYPTEYIRPYGDYNIVNGVWSPEIRYKRNLVKVVATLGVRF